MNSTIVFDHRNSEVPVISFLVPIFNEKKTIISVLQELSKFPKNHEIILIDDGSTDGTRDLLHEQIGANTMILFHDKNAGKGAAIQTGLQHTRGAYVAIQDADLEYNPMEYGEMLNIAENENLAAVFGSRFLRENPAIYQRFLLGNKIMTFWINFLTRGRFTDTYTCFKLIKREVFASLKLSSRGFEIEAEICVKISRLFRHIREVPIHYQPRMIEEGKKIGARDAVKGAITALKTRLSLK